MKKTYYLRLEGVNLDNFVYDTNDLSTIRGGSWLLLEAPERVVEHLQGCVEWADTEIKMITQGASWGLLSLKVEEDQAYEIIKKIRSFLASDDRLKFATFVVDILHCTNEEEYPKVRDRLAALNRYRQLQTPTLVYPESSPKQEFAGKVCAFDFVSPATRTFGGVVMGDSVCVRREKGRDKKNWYCKKCGLQEKSDDWKHFPQPAPDFSTIACSSDGEQYGYLDGKMAVIYLDGNHFGKLQRDFCNTVEQQQEFDKKIRVEFQDATLKTLLNEMQADKDWLNIPDEPDIPASLRLETLLWGGDEIIWVVPAWRAWWLLGRFYQEVRENWKLKGEPLTLAGGLVFCNHKTPIHRIVELAQKLGDEVKRYYDRNGVALQVLESYDHTGSDFNSFRKSYVPSGSSRKEMILNGEEMLPLLDAAKEIKTVIPKRQLYRLVSLLYQPGDCLEEKEKREQYQLSKSLIKLLGAKEREALEDCFGTGHAKWLLLLELWDYLEPKTVEEKETTGEEN